MSNDKEAVLSYLDKVNRPFSVNDILQSMHSDRTKTIVQKALDQLVAEKKIREKIYNKQKIYSALQRASADINDAQNEMQQIESEILQKTEVLNKLTQELKSFEIQLEKYQSMLTSEEAEKKKLELQSCVNNLQTKLSLLSENKVLIPKTDRDKIEKNYNAILKTYKIRKRICMDIINSILESYPKSKSMLMEEIGIELDDENVINILKT